MISPWITLYIIICDQTKIQITFQCHIKIMLALYTFPVKFKRCITLHRLTKVSQRNMIEYILITDTRKSKNKYYLPYICGCPLWLYLRRIVMVICKYTRYYKYFNV